MIMNVEKKFNLKYAASMTGFFGLFASMFSFVSVYLLHKGYDNATIGAVLSVSGIVSIILQTGQASFLDKRPQSRIQDTISINILIVLIGSVLLFFTNANYLVLGLIVFIFAFAQSSETLLNSMAFIYERFGVKINYGFGRGMGSASFAVMTMLIGYIVEATTPNLIPVFYIVIGAILFLIVRSYKHPLEQENPDEIDEILDEIEATDNSLLDFLQRYKRLVLLMMGAILLMFTHILISNFFIQIITPIGGNSAMMGTAVFIGAIMELPAMINYEWIERRISANNLLKIAGFFFLIKHVMTLLAPNITVIYIAQFLQIGGFALFYPASVSYVRKVVSKKDAVKGQSLFTSAMAASSVLGSFIGGVLLDELGVPVTLSVGIIANVIGLVIVIVATQDKKVTVQELI